MQKRAPGVTSSPQRAQRGLDGAVIQGWKWITWPNLAQPHPASNRDLI
jgi:hypothetical protein